MRDWGKRLFLLLERRGYTQKCVSEQLGVTPQAVYKWTVGGEIDHMNLRKLARLLDVNWVWLRYGEEALAEAKVEHDTEDRASVYRHRALLDAAKNEQWARGVCSALGVGVWHLHLVDGTSYWSEAARCLLGVDQSEPISQSKLRRLVHPESLEEMDGSFRRMVRTKQQVVWTFRLKRDPSPRITVVGNPVKNRKGDVEQIFGLMFEENFIDGRRMRMSA